MKVVLELPLKVSNFRESQFNWLKSNNNDSCLFVIENGKVLRTISIKNEPGKELNSATLTESRTCTCLSWNKSLDKLAVVVDKKLIYIWDIGKNNFTHFKPASKMLSLATDKTVNRNRVKEINLIAWSKVTNKFIVCYSSAQLLICNSDSSFSEKFIDNSYGVLKEVISIESCESVDLFACITIIFEILVMTFDGDTKFYIQGEDLAIISAKFSSQLACLSSSRSPTSGQQALHSSNASDESIWLAYQSVNGRIFFKRIVFENYHFSETTLRTDVIFVSDYELEGQVIDYYWLASNRLLVCYSTGSIVVLQIVFSAYNQQQQTPEYSVREERILSLRQDDENSSISSLDSTSIDFIKDDFKSFKLISYKDHNNTDADKSYSMAIISSYKLLYYELVQQQTGALKMEKVDDIDLTSSLKRVNLTLERVDWCYDSSMLALQLTDGHILIYRTKLQDYMVASRHTRTAYLSGASEVTLLNFDATSGDKSPMCSGSAVAAGDSADELPARANEHASIINVNMKPSLISIGPRHLVVALNNRVQFYLLDAQLDQPDDGGSRMIDELEYASIVNDICLNSKFIAVFLNDGRLKLHSIKPSKLEISSDDNRQEDDCLSETFEERFFPDPSRPETISSFTLTEKVLIYCTRELSLIVFSLESFAVVQNCHLPERPVVKLRQNQLGNMFVCFLEPQTGAGKQNNVLLYDLYSNKLFPFAESSHQQLYANMLESQNYYNLPERCLFNVKLKLEASRKWPSLGDCQHAIWDSDGTCLLLIEKKSIHVLVVLRHTLASEEPLVLYVNSVDKPSSYTTLYALHGIVSYQTSLGRVINSILESHDDETNLIELEHNIQTIKNQASSRDSQTPEETLADQLEVLALKSNFLDSILALYPISKCRDVCEHLIEEAQFNFDASLRLTRLDQVLWRKLAVWALFTLNLNFASLLYRKFGPNSHASVLNEIIADAQRRGLDAKVSLRTRLLILLNCEI